MLLLLFSNYYHQNVVLSSLSTWLFLITTIMVAAIDWPHCEETTITRRSRSADRCPPSARLPHRTPIEHVKIPLYLTHDSPLLLPVAVRLRYGMLTEECGSRDYVVVGTHTGQLSNTQCTPSVQYRNQCYWFGCGGGASVLLCTVQ